MSRPAPPSGQAPPAYSADGVAEFPGDLDRYGPAARDWEVHDTLWTLAWAADPDVDLGAQVEWLAGVLAARDFALAQLARNLELAAEECEAALGSTPASDLRAAAAAVRARA